MDIGAAGLLIIFFSLMVAQILVGGLILAYAGYSFLHVLISTSAGNDRIEWPGDPLFDWLFKGWYLSWIAVLSVLPGFLVVSLARIPPSSPTWGIALAGSACFCFPIFLLSSMSGSSRLHIVRGEILRGMLRRLGLVLIFYFLTATILLGCTAFVWYALVKADLLLVPVATICLAVGLFLYARLLGRLGHAITEEPVRKNASKPAKPRGISASARKDPWGVPEIPLPPDENSKPKTGVKQKQKQKKKSQNNVVDPWAIPELEPLARPRRQVPSSSDPLDPLGPQVGGYDVQPAEKPKKPLTRQTDPVEANDAFEAYGMAEANAAPEPRPQLAPALTEVSKYEIELASSRQRPELPANPMLTGIFNFPFYPTSLGPLVTIALGLSAMGLIARAQMAVFPH